MALMQRIFRGWKGLDNLKTCAACGCCKGFVRKNNEDNFFFAGKILPQENDGMVQILTYEASALCPVVFGVFDGMGGEAAGEVAAYLAARELCAVAEETQQVPREKLLKTCMRANGRICAYARQQQTGVVGTTAVMLYLDGNRAVAVNLGDSRLYRLRGGEFVQCSVDHINRGMSVDESGRRRKPSLTQHLGIEPQEMQIEPAVWEDRIQVGDVFLLCTDGLTDMLSEEKIRQSLTAETTSVERVRRLLEAALVAGGRDNVTVIVCEVYA